MEAGDGSLPPPFKRQPHAPAREREATSFPNSNHMPDGMWFSMFSIEKHKRPHIAWPYLEYYES
jgi:hypothetical protein